MPFNGNLLKDIFMNCEQTHWAGIKGYTGQCQKIMPESSTLASVLSPNTRLVFGPDLETQGGTAEMFWIGQFYNENVIVQKIKFAWWF